jgi:hypothetical protein
LFEQWQLFPPEANYYKLVMGARPDAVTGGGGGVCRACDRDRGDRRCVLGVGAGDC